MKIPGNSRHGNGDFEHISGPLGRIFENLARARPTPPGEDTLDVIYRILLEASETVPDLPAPATDAIDTCLSLLAGDYPQDRIRRIERRAELAYRAQYDAVARVRERRARQ